MRQPLCLQADLLLRMNYEVIRLRCSFPNLGGLVVKLDQLIRRIEIRDRTGRVVGSRDVVTYQGLLSRAHDEGLTRVKTTLVQVPSDDNGRTAIAKVEIETGKGTFEALGDANPENVNSFIVPHLIRMAETRAKARALRDAVNVGVISFEELDGETSEDFGDGSGVHNQPSRARGLVGERRSDTPTKQPEATSVANGVPSMSEAQRRYLFRLLAGQGLQGEDAHEHLKTLFGVESLKGVSKGDASELIDRLVNGEFQEASIHGTAVR